jgi:hypothetical protein
MATKNSATLKNRVFNGSYGNVSKASGTAIFDGDAADTVVRCLELPEGSTILGLKAYRDAMGAGTGLTVGLEFPDGEATDDDDFFGTVADSSAVGTLTYDAKPYSLPGRAYLTVTITDAAGTGSVVVVPEYKYDGIL